MTVKIYRAWCWLLAASYPYAMPKLPAYEIARQRMRSLVSGIPNNGIPYHVQALPCSTGRDNSSHDVAATSASSLKRTSKVTSFF